MTDPLRAALTYIIDQYEQNTLTRADILDAAAALAKPVPDHEPLREALTACLTDFDRDPPVSFVTDWLPRIRAAALAQPVPDSPPYTGDIPAGTIDYDPVSGEYVHTQRLGPDEYGASMLLARLRARGG